jgi:hypothetical protein
VFSPLVSPIVLPQPYKGKLRASYDPWWEGQVSKPYFSSFTAGLLNLRSTLLFLLELLAAAGVLTSQASEHFPVLAGLSATNAAKQRVRLNNARNRPSSIHHSATLPSASRSLCLHQRWSNSFTTDDSLGHGHGHGDPPRTQIRVGKGCPGWNGTNS